MIDANINPFEKGHFYSVVGTAIRAAREAASMSQGELCRRTKLSTSTLQNAEAGATCSLLVIARIAEALDTTLDALVPTEATDV